MFSNVCARAVCPLTITFSSPVYARDYSIKTGKGKLKLIIFPVLFISRGCTGPLLRARLASSWPRCLTSSLFQPVVFKAAAAFWLHVRVFSADRVHSMSMLVAAGENQSIVAQNFLSR